MDFKEINFQVSKLVKQKVNIIKFKTWCKFIENAYMDGNNIIIPVPNDFYKEIIKERYVELCDSVYSLYKEQLGYDKIIIKIDKNTEEVLEKIFYQIKI